MEDYLRRYANGLATNETQAELMRLRVRLLDGPIRCPYCPGKRTTRRNRITTVQSFGRHIGWCHPGIAHDWGEIGRRFRTIQRSWRAHGYVASERLVRAWDRMDRFGETTE